MKRDNKNGFIVELENDWFDKQTERRERDGSIQIDRKTLLANETNEFEWDGKEENVEFDHGLDWHTQIENMSSHIVEHAHSMLSRRYLIGLKFII